MAANPNPSHITAAMWWFVEEWERMEPETVYAGSWGDFKPGYHADYWTLKHHSGWEQDYSVQLADDKVPYPHPNEHMGAAVDITFPSAQAGNFANIKKYGARIRAAWVARDPRLKGWREVLCNADTDTAADGYDFVFWTERTPDDTHKWHMHFSCLRKYVNVLEVFQAMLSILRGETLAQWRAGKDDDVPKAIFTTKGYWLCQGGKREPINDADDMAKVTEVYGNVCWPKADLAGFPVPQVDLPVAQGGRGWSWDEIDRLLGRAYVPPSSGTGGSLVEHSHDIATTSGPAKPAGT